MECVATDRSVFVAVRSHVKVGPVERNSHVLQR